MSPIPVTRVLAELAVEARAETLAPDVAASATAVLLDWCAVAIGGATAPPATKLRDALSGGGGHSQLVGVAGSAEPATAALVNGTAAHTLELDDIYAPGLYHPGAPTIAAALAAAEREGVGGERLLRAIVIGYEIGNRVAETLGPEHYAYWHTTGTAGSLAAAAAVAEVLELDADRFAHTLALAATMGAGLQQTFRTDSMGKPLHSGHAAQTGVVAGFSARSGFTGTLDTLDGEIGMGVAMSGSPSWAEAGRPFGPAYLVQQTTVKPYSCCGHTFAAIDAALELREAGIAAADVVAVGVHSYATALTVAGNPSPTTPFEAKFSLPFVVAYALAEGGVGEEAFTDAVLARPEVRRVMSATALHEGAEFTREFPTRRGARVVVEDGKGRLHAATVPDRRGDPSNPMSPAQLDAKFLALVDGVVGETRARELQEQIRSIRTLTNVRDLRLGPRDQT